MINLAAALEKPASINPSLDIEPYPPTSEVTGRQSPNRQKRVRYGNIQKQDFG